MNSLSESQLIPVDCPNPSRERSKTPNEIVPWRYFGVSVCRGDAALMLPTMLDSPSVVILIWVALIPTKQGLLSAIGIAGMDRLPSLMLLPLPDGRWRLVATSTPCCWIRPALSHWVTAWQRSSYPSTSLRLRILPESLWQSVFDETPEESQLSVWQKKIGAKVTFDRSSELSSAKTRMSGTNLPDGGEARKGAVDAIRDLCVRVAET